ncbi:hypothetical protein B0J11DRAFT_516670 [Dendryphion nanum]|uniref:Uncharacterized protein n=1 Tax=Dendryphion nanum TaxID=256645 RepID=A0A9P9ELQ2_9PLEO|nr:hypothetical protein B0J11DRAFT_516670 [Dendryphion nanum]
MHSPGDTLWRHHHALTEKHVKLNPGQGGMFPSQIPKDHRFFFSSFACQRRFEEWANVLRYDVTWESALSMLTWVSSGSARGLLERQEILRWPPSRPDLDDNLQIHLPAMSAKFQGDGIRRAPGPMQAHCANCVPGCSESTPDRDMKYRQIATTCFVGLANCTICRCRFSFPIWRGFFYLPSPPRWGPKTVSESQTTLTAIVNLRVDWPAGWR